MSDLLIRDYDDADEDIVLELLAGSLGWLPDAGHREFFRWKHLQNPAGRSAMWVAESAGQIVGFRSMLRWVFDVDGAEVHAVRAVDTATAPAARGQGVFRALTLHAVAALTAEGVGFVFNTPNDQSRPGYLKMGWIELGRPPAAARPSGPLGALRAARSRTPAELWSLPSDAGVAATEGLSGALPTGPQSLSGLATRRRAEHLQWRYGLPSLSYRALRRDDGIAIFRLRRRGHATEAAVCEVLADDDDGARRLVQEVARVSGADHLLRLGRAHTSWRELPLPGGGPILTWRALASTTPVELSRWRLSLGDVELL